MIRPTIEKIDKIIYKLKELQTTIANIEDRPPEFPTCDIKDNKSITIEQFIKAAAGQSFELTKNEKSKMPTNPELLAEFMDLYSPQKSFEKALRILPTLSMDNLKKLLNDDIPKLLAIDSISKKEIFPGSISSAGTSGAGPIIRDSDAMHKLKIIQFYVEQQIKKMMKYPCDEASAAAAAADGGARAPRRTRWSAVFAGLGVLVLLLGIQYERTGSLPSMSEAAMPHEPRFMNS